MRVPGVGMIGVWEEECLAFEGGVLWGEMSDSAGRSTAMAFQCFL